MGLKSTKKNRAKYLNLTLISVSESSERNMDLAYQVWGGQTHTLLKVSGERDRDKSLKSKRKSLLSNERKAQKETSKMRFIWAKKGHTPYHI